MIVARVVTRVGSRADTMDKKTAVQRAVEMAVTWVGYTVG